MSGSYWIERILLAAGVCGLSVSASAKDVTPELAGHYYLQHVRETGSELLLRPDGSYEWMLSYGAVDEYSAGHWRREANEVVLQPNPLPTGPVFFLGDTTAWDVDAEQALLDQHFDAQVDAIDQRCPEAAIASTQDLPAPVAGDAAPSPPPPAAPVDPKCQYPEHPVAKRDEPTSWVRGAALRFLDTAEPRISGSGITVSLSAPGAAAVTLKSASRGFIVLPPALVGKAMTVRIRIDADEMEMAPPLVDESLSLPTQREGVQTIRFDHGRFVAQPFAILRLTIDGGDLTVPEAHWRYHREP